MTEIHQLNDLSWMIIDHAIAVIQVCVRMHNTWPKASDFDCQISNALYMLLNFSFTHRRRVF